MAIPAPGSYGPAFGAPVASPPLGYTQPVKSNPFAGEDFASALGIPAPVAPTFGPAPSSAPAPSAAVAPVAPAGSNPFTASSLAPLETGLSAIAPASESSDVESGVINTGTSALEGAVGGALSGAAIGAAGGPIGALGGAAIGGGTALLTGALNAFLGVSATRKANRAKAQLIAAAQAKQDALLKQQRDDAIGQETYNRSQAAKAQQYQLFQDQQKKLADLFLASDAAKQKYVQDGWVR